MNRKTEEAEPRTEDVKSEDIEGIIDVDKKKQEEGKRAESEDKKDG